MRRTRYSLIRRAARGGMLAAMFAVLAPAPAPAWDARDSDVALRVAELDASWADLGHDGIIRNIVTRASQERPDWVGAKPWQSTRKGRTYGFASGACSRKTSSGNAVAKAEAAARAALGRMFGRETIGAAMVDWYRSPNGAFHALAAMEFAREETAAAESAPSTPNPVESPAPQPLGARPALPAEPGPPAVPSPQPQPVILNEPRTASGMALPAGAEPAPKAPIDRSKPAALHATDYLARAEDSIRASKFGQARTELNVALSLLGPRDRLRLRCQQRLGHVAFKERNWNEAHQAYLDGIMLAKSLGARGRIKGELYAGLGLTLAEQGRRHYAASFLKAALKSRLTERTRKQVLGKLKALEDRTAK